MKKISDNLYMFDAKTNVLLYTTENECILIDSGKSSKLKQQIKDFILWNKLKLTGIINTHCHSDHISNNDIGNCKVYASDIERNMIESYNIQLDVLFGGKHPKFIEETFLSSKSFKTYDLPKIDNIEYVLFPGHSYNMIAICIEKKFLYIGDALFSENELKSLPYIYDVKKFLDSVSKLKEYENFVIISSHCGIIDNLDYLIELNIKFINQIKNMIIENCKNGKTFDEIVSFICENKNISLNEVNYFLITSTIKSFISYLIDNKLLEMIFKKYNLYYKSKC